MVQVNLAPVYTVLVCLVRESLVPVRLVNLVQASLARGNVVFLGQDLVQIEHQGSQGLGNTLGMDHHLVHLVRLHQVNLVPVYTVLAFLVRESLVPVCLVLVSGMALDTLGVVLDQDQLSLEWDSVQASLVLVNLAPLCLVLASLALMN